MALAPDSLDQVSDEQSTELEGLIHQFEQAWQRGPAPVIENYLPSEPARGRCVLWELVHTDLEYRLQAGELVRIENYLHRFPELEQDRAAVVEFIAAEYELHRRRLGPLPEEYLQRFRKYRAELL